MRSVLLGVVLALGGSAPAAAATGDPTFSGRCEILGIATFEPPLLAEPRPTGYALDGIRGKSRCTGTLNGRPVESAPVFLDAKGGGELGCGWVRDGRGSGRIVFTNGTDEAQDDVVIAYRDRIDTFGPHVPPAWRMTLGGTRSGEASGLVAFTAGYSFETITNSCRGENPDGGLKSLYFEMEIETASPLVGEPLPPAVAADARIRIRRESLTRVLRRGLPVVIEAPGAVEAHVLASTVSGLRLGRADVTLDGARSVRVPVRPVARRRLARARSARVSVRALLHMGDGRFERVAATALLRR